MKYSVIAPVYNEEGNVELLLGRVTDVMDGLGEEYEILIVDDGSTDDTLGRLIGLLRKFPRLRVISLRKNSGQTVALQAGFDNARGERIITIDGDLEKDPKFIPEMIDKMEKENLDLVYFQKLYAKDVPWKRRFASRVANRFRNMVMGDEAVDVGSTFKVYRKNWLKGRNYGSGFHRFFIGFMEAEGLAMGHVRGDVRNRPSGETKYTNWGRLKQGLSDLFYFYLYKNRRVGAPKLILSLAAAGVATYLLPLPGPVKSAVYIVITVLLAALFALTVHVVHLLVQQKKAPYDIKGVWPE